MKVIDSSESRMQEANQGREGQSGDPFESLVRAEAEKDNGPGIKRR